MPKSEEPSAAPPFEPVPVSSRRLVGTASGSSMPLSVVVGNQVKKLTVRAQSGREPTSPNHVGHRGAPRRVPSSTSE